MGIMWVIYMIVVHVLALVGIRMIIQQCCRCCGRCYGRRLQQQSPEPAGRRLQQQSPEPAEEETFLSRVLMMHTNEELRTELELYNIHMPVRSTKSELVRRYIADMPTGATEMQVKFIYDLHGRLGKAPREFKIDLTVLRSKASASSEIDRLNKLSTLRGK